MQVLKNGFIKWTKADFEIRGRRTGSQLRGRENEYVYEIFWNGKRFEGRQFSSKERASMWLGRQLRMANEIRRVAYEQGRRVN